MSHVIARLKGGLGNQMFQFATGYAVAQRLGVPLLLDTSVLSHRGEGSPVTARGFELDVFATNAHMATAEQVAELDSAGPFSRLMSKVRPGSARVVAERARQWNAAVGSCKAPVLLDGYWQNERYFSTVARDLRERIFVPVASPAGTNKELYDAIRATDSASLHVRRGDYVSDAITRNYHGLLPVQFFEKAAALLVAAQGVQRFFVFSDDPAWVKNHLHLPASMIVVDHNAGRNAHWDLFLMKNCRHHIIANSSFSWWGAWLNTDPGKVVVAPSEWFQGDPGAADHILPPGWLRLPSS